MRRLVVDRHGRDAAMFSPDRTRRYLLQRDLRTPGFTPRRDRVLFVMLNPSTADAFANDPTIGECVKRARRWGFAALDVVNLFALRTPKPRELRAATDRGDDAENDAQILLAARRAEMIVCAWGNHGELAGRNLAVLARLGGAKLHHLGVSMRGHPKHPLARGRHRIPADRRPTAWAGYQARIAASPAARPRA